MVPFAGWEMPLQYSDSIIESHLHCRSSASLFDVSHMQIIRLHGEKRNEYLESLTVVDLKSLEVGNAKLSLIINKNGGIIDDTIITNKGNHISMVVNAGCSEKDIKHFSNELKSFGKGVEMEVVSDESLLAIQGPKSVQIVQKLTDLDLSKVKFMTSNNAKVGGFNVVLNRCGYTGEDGFEIAVKNKDAVGLAEKLLKESSIVKPCGLAARDTLRLESGLCLYGNDMEENRNPVEASLVWTIDSRRKKEGGFLGSKIVLEAIKNGTKQKRVGFVVLSGPPARQHAPIFDSENGGKQIGEVTSGTMSPSLKKSIGMCYVDVPFNKIDSKLFVEVRGKRFPISISKMPFVEHHYFK